jgi:hypothetical protein
LDLPNGVEYTIIYPEIEGYSTPSVYTGIKQKDYNRQHIAEYLSEFVIVNVTSDTELTSEYSITITSNMISNDYIQVEYLDNNQISGSSDIGAYNFNTNYTPTDQTRVEIKTHLTFSTSNSGQVRYIFYSPSYSEG